MTLWDRTPATPFADKTRKLFEKQLPLSAQVRDDVAVQRVLLRGRMFYPITQERPDSLPTMMASEHLKGTWLRVRDSQQLVERHSDEGFVVLHKPLWLSPVELSENDAAIFTVRDIVRYLEQHFAKSRRPLLLAAGKCVDGSFRETERLFVMSNRWPLSESGPA